MGNSKLVSHADGNASGQSQDISSQEGYAIYSRDTESSSIVKYTTHDGMSYIRESFQSRNISPEATDILMASWRHSTQKQYSTYINKWVLFCNKRQINSFHTSVDTVIEFLTELFHSGYSYETLNSTRSALSSLCDLQDGYTIGSHPLAVKFMTGVFNLRPTQPRYKEFWDVSLVLDYLRTLMPVSELSLKQLSYKLAMLIALTQASRTQSLSLITLDGLHRDENSYTLFYDKLLKQSKKGRINPVLKLKRYTDCEVCVVYTLEHYITRTEQLRGSEQRLFISYMKPYKVVSSSTISRWLRNVLTLSGIDVSKYKSHSVRGVAASKAKACGLPISEIMSVAGWASDKTFSKFYDKPVAKSEELSFQDAVFNKT